MSFDLFTYIGESSEENLINWQQCLEQAGIKCKIPTKVHISDDVFLTPIKCKLYAPLVQTGTYIDDCDFFVELMPINDESIAEIIADTNDLDLIAKLKSVKYDIKINTNEEDSYEVGMQIICFVSATLANAFDGVLVDPQEFGVVYGAKVYDVARYYSDLVKPKQNTKPDQSETSSKQKHKSLFKRLLPWGVFFVSLTFISDMIHLFSKS